MLVLSRQRDETIMIGDQIEITVVDIRGDKVRLGINAPREVQVHRKEVYDAIKRENADASTVQVDDLTAVNHKLRNTRTPGNPGTPGTSGILGNSATPGTPGKSMNPNGNKH